MSTDPKTERCVVEVVYDAIEFVLWIVFDPISCLLCVLLCLGVTFYFRRKPAPSAQPANPHQRHAFPYRPPYVDRAHEARHVPVDPWAALNKKIVRPAVTHIPHKAQ